MKEALRNIINIFEETSDYEEAKEKCIRYLEVHFDKINQDTFDFVDKYDTILAEKTQEFIQKGHDPVEAKDHIASEAACAILGQELCQKAAALENKHPDLLNFVLKAMSDLTFMRLKDED